MRGEQWACALGAAWSGVAKEPPRGDIYDALPSVFPELGHFVTHPLTGERAAAMQVVNNLNEQTRYSREAIADWLCVEGGCKHRVRRPIKMRRQKKAGVVVVAARHGDSPQEAA